MITRQEKILSCIDLENQLGIEIGALNKPIVTSKIGNIRYVDHASTEDLKQKYATDPNVDVEAIVDVNYVWGEKTLPELVADEAPFDYVIASHVIEHVPDLIGWLKEIHAVLKPGGILSLAIPDKRYCFDYYRSLTQPAEVVDAYLRGQRKPEPRQVFDFLSSVACWQGNFAWGPDSDFSVIDLVRIHSNTAAWQLTQEIFASPDYYDVHCWVFTPHSFFDLIRTLIQINLFDYRLVEFYQTEGCEFHVSLEAIDLTKDEAERHRIQLESLPSMQLGDVVQVSEMQSLVAELEQEKARNRLLQSKVAEFRVNFKQFQRRLKQLRNDKQRLLKKVSALQTDLELSRKEVAAMQSSKFWKIRTYWLRLKQALGLKK
jgi:SAM-dependent methyltransferase